MIIWASNASLDKVAFPRPADQGIYTNTLGSLLNEYFENDIFIIGFYFSAGKAADGPTHTLEKNDLREAPESSIQRRLLDLGQSSLFLNLSAIDDGSEKFEWVFNPLPSWSKFKYPYYQAEEILINKYDGLTWFKNITSSDYIDVMYLWDDW